MDVLSVFHCLVLMREKKFSCHLLECSTAITATEPGTRYYGAVIYGVPLRHTYKNHFIVNPLETMT